MWDFIHEQGWINSLTKGEWMFLDDERMRLVWPDVCHIQTLAVHRETGITMTVRKSLWPQAREQYVEIMQWRASCARALQAGRVRALDSIYDEAERA